MMLFETLLLAGLAIALTLLSAAENPRAISREPSIDLSSTITSSNYVKVWSGRSGLPCR